MPKIIENVRDRIIEEGKNILVSHGYSALNIREIAHRCGIGTGTFYNYFSNKQELAKTIFEEDWNKALKLVDNLKDSDEELKEKLRKIYNDLQGFIDNYMSIFYEIANIEKVSYERRNMEKSEMERLYIKVQELLEFEKSKGNVTTNLSLDKLSRFIISNLIYISKNKFMSFDEMYDEIKI